MAPRQGYWMCGRVVASETLTITEAPVPVDADDQGKHSHTIVGSVGQSGGAETQPRAAKVNDLIKD